MINKVLCSRISVFYIEGGCMFFSIKTESDVLHTVPRRLIPGLQSIKLLLFSILFAGFTGLCAQLRFYLPFTPVPVTGQVFAVLLSAAVLGKGYGSLSQIFYTVFGLCGVPWFVVGPLSITGGYIVGFIVAPYLIGSLMERSVTRGRNTEQKADISARLYGKIPGGIEGLFRHIGTMLHSQYNAGLHIVRTCLAMISGVFLIYLFGLVQFSLYTRMGLIDSLRFAVLPFLPFDIGKALLAASLSHFMLNRKAAGV